MEFFAKIIQWVQQVPAKDMQRYMYMLIGVIGLCVAVIVIMVRGKSNDLVEQLKKLEKTARSAGPIFKEYEKIKQEELRIEAMLEKNKDEDMKSFFELFCKNQNMVPQPGWDTSTANLNEKFEEMTVQATFKGQSTQALVEFLDAIEKEAASKNKILYTKNLHIKKDQSENTINFDLTIATVRIKKEG